MKRYITLSVLALSALVSCTNLDEEIFSQMEKNQFLSEPDNVALYISKPYTSLQNWGSEQSLWTLIMQLTNEVAVPRSYGGSWKEERYGELQRHEIPTNNKLSRLGWEFCLDGVAACNDALALLNNLPASASNKKNIAEIRVLRAYYYLMAVDGWGNVPFSISKEEKDYPEQKGRSYICPWIETEIKESLPDLDEANGTSTYGRITKGAAQFILAKLYINSEEWLGTQRWKDTEDICKSIIDDGKYSLAANYKDNFEIYNENTPEAIFAIPYSSVYTKSKFYPWVLTFDARFESIFNIGGTWDGSFIGQPDFMASYEAGDTRKADTWLFGQVYTPAGQKAQYMSGTDSKTKEPIMKDLILEDINIDQSKFDAKLDTLDGARIWKWTYQTDGTLTNYYISMENDFILMRYADVVLMYVEALVRQGKTAEAAEVAEFKAIRSRAGLAPIAAADLNLDNLLLERQHELAMEGWSRQDLIRFGKYTDAWWAKAADKTLANGDKYTKLLPVPLEAIGNNPKLIQNPGYDN